ncbi:MAG TPA: phage tail protein [Desulfobulbaceae bacterium]|nr:phage tail protein [Desulfobulbaceae bacterium]
MAKYLDTCGELLDLIRHTLDQRLADSFPDNPEKGLACQPWLLPYFARLVDARLVSPDDKGRRDEVGNAVAWRQRKGTRTAVEQIAESVARTETEIQEGWKRVATTPRIGMPLLPATALGESNLFDKDRQHLAWAARHPGLPSAVMDLRYPSRAMQLNTATNATPQNPAAHLTEFAGEKSWWRQVNPHGAPCFPGSFEDVSSRTVDMRTPNWQHGHFHPKRVLLFVPPPTCFFESEPDNFQEGLELGEDKEHVLENQVITKTLRVTAGRLKLVHCMVENLKIEIPASAESEVPVLIARDCLISEAVVNGAARLEYCTITGNFTGKRLQASDSLFAGDKLTLEDATDQFPHCIRYSRVLSGLSAKGLLMYHNTMEQPAFFNFEFDEGDHAVWRQARFGEPGYAVLHPATPEAIRFGAEDGGEMGAYHSRHYCLLHAAMLDKLRDFLPLGIEAVLIPDPRLQRLPILPCEPQDS